MSSENPYQSPESLQQHPPSGAGRGDGTLASILFSFNGRVTRSVYWGVTLLSTFAFYALVFLAVLGLEEQHAEVVLLLLYVPMLWISLAVQVKRWHDRNKSGWWVLIALVPFLGPLWVLIEVGFMDGTVGPNHYGPDPRGRASRAPVDPWTRLTPQEQPDGQVKQFLADLEGSERS